MSSGDMSPARIAVFDLGKVLLDFDYERAVCRLAAASATTRGAIRDLLLHSSLLERYETGRLSSPSFYEEFRQSVRYEGDYTAFRQSFADIFTPVESMVRLNQSLRERQVPTYILSNTNEIAIDHVRRQYPFFRDFCGFVLSYEHGAMKPQPTLYEIIEHTTAGSGQEICFLDDREENVAAGRERGWRAHQHKDSAETWAFVRGSGLLG